MAYKNHWLQGAAKNFDDIYLYYKQVAGDNVAKRRVSRILQATEVLEFMPNIGRIDEEFPHTPSYRYLIVMDYHTISSSNRQFILQRYGIVGKAAKCLVELNKIIFNTFVL